jgi:hypothetical protein
MAGARKRLRRCLAAGLSVLALITARDPAVPREAPATVGSPRLGREAPALVTLAATGVPRAPRFSRVVPVDVQESCVGRHLPGDLETVGGPPVVIDKNPLTSWHCDGDGARLSPPQSLAVFFARPVTLSAVGVAGYDPLRPCRFVTAMRLDVGTGRYRILLPSAPYQGMRWFALPPVRADRITLAVLATTVPAGRHGPDCARTAIAKVAFAVRR